MGVCNSSPVDNEVERFVVPQAGFAIDVRTVKRLGWVRDLPDFRDRKLALPEAKRTKLPKKFDLRPAEFKKFPIYDQGELGSCTANAIGAAFHYDQIKQGKVDFCPSRLFLYYNERAMEGSIDTDAGAQIRDGMKSLNKIGICSEALWPYDTSTFTQKPSDACYEKAAETKAVQYAQVPQDLDHLRGCLNEGFPIVFGFMVFKSFMSKEVAETGKMRFPGFFEQLLGGHAVLCVGYDDDEKHFIIRNSWGESWGDNGYFYMPYGYLTNSFLANDLWAVKSVSGPDLPTTAVTSVP